MKSVFKGKSGKCAKETMEWLVKHSKWEDTYVYVNGYRLSYDVRWDYYIDWNSKDCYERPRIIEWDKVKVETDMNPRDYFKYVGDFMSMSFEGNLYDAINYGDGRCEESLQKLFEKYGKYFELGNAWNLSLYDL